MNLHDGQTIVEYEQHDNIGHLIGVSAEVANHGGRWVQLGLLNTVLNDNGEVEPGLVLAPHLARELAAALLLAADHLDGGFDLGVYGGGL